MCLEEWPWHRNVWHHFEWCYQPFFTPVLDRVTGPDRRTLSEIKVHMIEWERVREVYVPSGTFRESHCRGYCSGDPRGSSNDTNLVFDRMLNCLASVERCISLCEVSDCSLSILCPPGNSIKQLSIAWNITWLIEYVPLSLSWSVDCWTEQVFASAEYSIVWSSGSPSLPSDRIVKSISQLGWLRAPSNLEVRQVDLLFKVLIAQSNPWWDSSRRRTDNRPLAQGEHPDCPLSIQQWMWQSRRQCRTWPDLEGAASWPKITEWTSNLKPQTSTGSSWRSRPGHIGISKRVHCLEVVLTFGVALIMADLIQD